VRGPRRTLFGTGLGLLAGACLLASPGPVRAENGAKPLLARVRIAMGLADTPGEPMRLVPPRPRTVLSPEGRTGDHESAPTPGGRRIGAPALTPTLQRPPARPEPPGATAGAARPSAIAAGSAQRNPSPVPRPHPLRTASIGSGPPATRSEGEATERTIDARAEHVSATGGRGESAPRSVSAVAPPPPGDAGETTRGGDRPAAETRVPRTGERAPEDGVEDDGELPRLVRMLSALQDDIARGSASALAAQRVLARRIVEAVERTPGHLLAERANARAILAFALTGGGPAPIRTARSKATFAPPHDALMAGALAYLEGRQKDALRHFRKIDTADLDAVLKGPVELVLAALTVGDDPQAALRHLALARLAAPGTLIEEAALRRAVLITAERDDYPRFARLAGRYMRKFRGSVYAGNFRRRLAGALTRMSFLEEPDGFARLQTLLAPMTEGGRREIALTLARSAVEAGRHAVAARAAELSRSGADDDTLDARRAELYAAAAHVVDPERTEEAVEALNAMPTAELPESDRVLRAAAIALGETVAASPTASVPAPQQSSSPGRERGPSPPGNGRASGRTALPPREAAPGENADENVPAPGAEAEALPPLPIEARVRDTLAAIDALLRTRQ